MTQREEELLENNRLLEALIFQFRNDFLKGKWRKEIDDGQSPSGGLSEAIIEDYDMHFGLKRYTHGNV